MQNYFASFLSFLKMFMISLKLSTITQKHRVFQCMSSSHTFSKFTHIKKEIVIDTFIHF